MEKHKKISYYLSQLNGHIRIIGGNHDNARCCHEYRELGVTVMGVLNYKGFICTHIPIHETQLEGFAGNIHGHIHKQGDMEGLGKYNPPSLDSTKYYNVNRAHFYNILCFRDYQVSTFAYINNMARNRKLYSILLKNLYNR
jgi:calcineurin-like phosphoesterase family protein